MDIEECPQDRQKDVLISQGAEAKVYLTTFLEERCIVKERLEKKYRHPDLDSKITKERISLETRNMARARELGVNTPYLLFIDYEGRKIYMQYVNNSLKLRDYLFELQKLEEKNQAIKELIYGLMILIGKDLAVIHDNDIIHGDLTTSNLLIKFENKPEQAISNFECFQSTYFIDFGLSYKKHLVEDKAVDLYVFERAFISTHPNLENEFNELLKSYESNSKNGRATLKRLNEVRSRGRKKLAFG